MSERLPSKVWRGQKYAITGPDIDAAYDVQAALHLELASSSSIVFLPNAERLYRLGYNNDDLSQFKHQAVIQQIAMVQERAAVTKASTVVVNGTILDPAVRVAERGRPKRSEVLAKRAEYWIPPYINIYVVGEDNAQESFRAFVTFYLAHGLIARRMLGSLEDQTGQILSEVLKHK